MYEGNYHVVEHNGHQHNGLIPLFPLKIIEKKKIHIEFLQEKNSGLLCWMHCLVLVFEFKF